MAQFITPPQDSGVAELTASTGLEIRSQGSWRFSAAGYNDGATFGLSRVGPNSADTPDRPGGSGQAATQSGGLLHLRAVNWPIAVIGNDLVSYTDPDSGVTYGADRCRITVRGRWIVTRQPNSNSMNSIGCIYQGRTETDLGDRDMVPTLVTLMSGPASYVIQGSMVQGGAIDTFSNHEWFCRCTETVTTDNSNRSFQSNTIVTPVWVYTYQRSWQID
jgi:hypothetical protein